MVVVVRHVGALLWVDHCHANHCTRPHSFLDHGQHIIAQSLPHLTLAHRSREHSGTFIDFLPSYVIKLEHYCAPCDKAWKGIGNRRSWTSKKCMGLWNTWCDLQRFRLVAPWCEVFTSWCPEPGPILGFFLGPILGFFYPVEVSVVGATLVRAMHYWVEFQYFHHNFTHTQPCHQ